MNCFLSKKKKKKMNPISELVNGALGLFGVKEPIVVKSWCACFFAKNVVGYAFIPPLSNVAPFTSPHVLACGDGKYLREYQGLLMSLNTNVNPAEAAHLMLNHADVFIQAPSHKSEDILSLSFGISRP